MKQKDPLLNYSQMAAYFTPPLHYDTLREWLRVTRTKVFRSPGANPFRGNKIVGVRKSAWEKLLKKNEKPLNARPK